MDEHALREKIMVETKKGGVKSKGPIVEITDVKVMRVNGKSRRFAFVGFKSVEMAQIAQFYWNKAFMGTARVQVEFAALPGSQAVRPWSKYSVGASANPLTKELKEKQKEQKGKGKALQELANMVAKNSGAITDKSTTKQVSDAVGIDSKMVDDVKRKKMLRALEMHPILFGLSEEQREKVLADSKFHDYISLVVDKKSKDRKFWDNDDQSRETNALRALYMASKDENKEEETEGVSYEKLMEQMKDKKAKGDDSDDDDDDYFDNPSLDSALEFSSSRDEQKEMKEVVETILKNKVANSAVKDDEYFKMMSSNFDSDDEEEEKDGEWMERLQKEADEDEEEDATSTKNTKKRAREEEEEEEEAEDEDDEDNKSKKQSDANKKPKHAPVSDDEARAIILETGKLFIRRLPFTTTSDELREVFEEYGSVKEVNVPVDINKQCKGFAYVHYNVPSNAWEAYLAQNGQVFQGRVMHILPGKKAEGEGVFDPENPFAGMGDDEIKRMSHKDKKKLIEKAQAGKGHNWNSLFINADTVANAIAHKFNMAKSSLLGANQADESDNIGVRMAVAETHMINETKTFLEEHGVLLSKFASRPGMNVDRSDTIMLIKNLPFDTEEQDLRKVLKKYGPIQRLILPPYRTVAVVEYSDNAVAKRAFMGTAYKKFKAVPLYVEWAPKGCLKPLDAVQGKGAVVVAPAGKNDKIAKVEKAVDAAESDSEDDGTEKRTAGKLAVEEEDEAARSLFVKNLHFDTKEESIRELFGRLASEAYKSYVAAMHAQGKDIPPAEWRVRAVVIAKRTVTDLKGADKNKKIGEVLSLGYGFIELSCAAAAKGVAALVEQRKGVSLDGHLLDVRVSSKADANSALHADLKKKTILVQKGILSEEKMQQQRAWAQTSSKLIVRNVPFEANAKEIRELFRSFGQLRRVRLPQKFDGQGHRGFAFVDFVTAQEARNAWNALQNTHLYGRHLVLEWAAPDETLEELREKAKKQIAK